MNIITTCGTNSQRTINAFQAVKNISVMTTDTQARGDALPSGEPCVMEQVLKPVHDCSFRKVMTREKAS